MASEVWKQIPNATDGFEISSKGRVRKPNAKNNFCEYGRDNGRGYMQTKVTYKDGNHKMRTIHSLVAESFLDNPNNYLEINHIDGNKKNNSSENLEYCSRKQNCIHASLTGLKKCRLTKDDVIFIRNSKLKQIELAEMFGVNQYMISKVKRKVSYTYY